MAGREATEAAAAGGEAAVAGGGLTTDAGMLAAALGATQVGFGRIVASEVEEPNMLANLV